MWVENILNKESVNLINQDTGTTDQFQNNVFNIYFANEDFSRVKILQQLSKIYKQKRALVKREKLNNTKYPKNHKSLNSKFFGQLEKLQTYDSTFVPKPKMVFI